MVNNQQVEYEKYLRDIRGTVDYMGAKHGLAQVEAAPLDAPTDRAPLVESASEILRTIGEQDHKLKCYCVNQCSSLVQATDNDQ